MLQSVLQTSHRGELGDIVYVDVDTVDDDLNGGDVFGSVEAVKLFQTCSLPISGKVIEFNSELEDQPELLNTDPYGDGMDHQIGNC